MRSTSENHALHRETVNSEDDFFADQQQRSPAPGFVQCAAWEDHPWLRAGFSTRHGGKTTVYNHKGEGEQNLGWTDSDSQKIVAQNRHHFLAAVSGDTSFTLATVHQIHSGITHVIRNTDGPLTMPDGKAILQGDGLLTADPGLLLGIMTADCVPILIADTRTHAVAAFHAGWRGTLARIVEHGVQAMQLNLGSDPNDLIAAIGPCIRACCFVIGPEVRTHFEAEFPYAAELFSERPMQNAPAQMHMDLQQANRRQLLSSGIPALAISTLVECSACSRLPNGKRKYFSHRAENGFTGRMMSVIGATS